MKKVFVIIGMLALSVASFGQSTYEKTMTAHIDSLYRTLKMGTVQKTIESIKHVFASEPNRWEALYYISYAYCKLSLTEKNDYKKDDLCDSSQLYLDKAMKCSPNNSELYVLQGFVYNTRLIVSPMMRFYQYLGQINMAYDMAEKLDSLNPRPNYMRAMLI